MLAVRPKTSKVNDELKHSLDQFISHYPHTADLIDKAVYSGASTQIHLQWGHAEHYGAPGIALLGDAVHPVSPAGGQGANMSIADAVALAELISAEDPARLITSYEQRRRLANERSISITRRVSQMVSLPGGRWLSSLLPPLLTLLNRKHYLLIRALSFASTAFVEHG